MNHIQEGYFYHKGLACDVIIACIGWGWGAGQKLFTSSSTYIYIHTYIHISVHYSLYICALVYSYKLCCMILLSLMSKLDLYIQHNMLSLKFCYYHTKYIGLKWKVDTPFCIGGSANCHNCFFYFRAGSPATPIQFLFLVHLIVSWRGNVEYLTNISCIMYIERYVYAYFKISVFCWRFYHKGGVTWHMR